MYVTSSSAHLRMMTRLFTLIQRNFSTIFDENQTKTESKLFEQIFTHWRVTIPKKNYKDIKPKIRISIIIKKRQPKRKNREMKTTWKGRKNVHAK